MDDPTLLELFDSREILYDTWNHRLHVRVAYVMVRCYAFDEALRRFRVGIRAYNLAHQVPDNLTSGYHETLTVAWIHLIAARANATPTTLDSDSFCNMHPELLEKNLLRQFYSTERSVTQEAKREFVEPDLRELPSVD